MLQLTLKNVKLLRKAKETTVEEPGPNGDFMRGRISAPVINIFMKTVSISNMALFHPLFTLGTLKTSTIFLDLKTCFAKVN